MAITIPVSADRLLELLEAIRWQHSKSCFFACQGPDAPPRSMATVPACWEGWRIRCLLIAHKAPIRGEREGT